MMGALAIRRTTVDALSATRRQVIRWALQRLALGEPARYSAAGVEWYVWDDGRLDLQLVAVVGALAAVIASVPADYDPATRTRAQVEADVRQVVGSRLVPPVTDAPDPWAATLSAQGAPAVVRAASGVPGGWEPVARASG
ncbi:MAG: hypothetical protein LC798_21515 [Chloroflexi bacterium]|nr:hypothetical protein [Chloroflexota bacterium]